MRRRVASVAALALAVGAAAVLAALAYRAASGDGTAPDPAAADAIAHFEASHSQEGSAARRRRAEAAARRLAERPGDPAVRALGSNLLGVLAFEDASLDRPRAHRHATTSVDAFREAIHLDPASDDAKFNLELALTLTPEDAAAASERGEGAGPSTGSGAGATPPGGGY
jgi:hypothetical protein